MTNDKGNCESRNTNDECVIRDVPLVLGSFLFLASCSLLLLTACGCSHEPDYPSATVSGTVNIDGKPVPKGFITFSPTTRGQGPVVGAKIVTGKYRCEKVSLGKHQVTFTAHAAEMTVLLDHFTGTNREVPKNILPSQYFAGLEAEVGGGDVTIDFPLQSKP